MPRTAFTLRKGEEPLQFFLFRLRWLNEALYHYQVLYTDNLIEWRPDLPGSSITAAGTGLSPVFTDPAAAKRRLYRIVRTPP